MESGKVYKLARALRVLMTICFVCNVIAVFFLPVAFISNSEDVLQGIQDYLDGILHPAEDDVVMAGVMASVIGWFWTWQEPHSLLLIACGVCTAVILWQGRRVLSTVLSGNPFCMENAVSLRWTALCCFLVSAFSVGWTVWEYVHFGTVFLPYNYSLLLCPMFFMGGLLALVMSALFRQAAGMKAENDLTI